MNQKNKLTFNERMQAYAEVANEHFREGRNRLGAEWAQTSFEIWVKDVMTCNDEVSA